MENSISTRILGIVMDHRNKTGYGPRFILLGYEEYMELRATADPSRYFYSLTNVLKETFMGIEILNVNREHFFDIAA
jgi:hypothetical protein